MPIYHCLGRIDAKSDKRQTRRLLVDAEKWFDLTRMRYASVKIIRPQASALQ